MNCFEIVYSSGTLNDLKFVEHLFKNCFQIAISFLV